MEKVAITQEGFTRIETEFKNLKDVERPKVIQAISEAREHGDLSENAEYSAAKEKQSFIEGRIQELESVISRADIIDIKSFSGDTVKFGATVTIMDEDTEIKQTWQIVGEIEADIKSGRISTASPIGRALIGKPQGDVIEVSSPGGIKSYEILKVVF
ncbi:MAG: transcription elongation factor GreA [Alphaproteobacteria bacterium]